MDIDTVTSQSPIHLDYPGRAHISPFSSALVAPSALIIDGIPADRRRRNFASSACCRFPDELLTAIFAINHQPIPLSASPSISDQVHFEGARHIRSVSQVCNRWRAAALSTASLWASVNLSLRVGPSGVMISSSCPEEMALRLERSREGPLGSPSSPSLPYIIFESLDAVGGLWSYLSSYVLITSDAGA